jgi:tetratricopeptide (TPR) repeat protein
MGLLLDAVDIVSPLRWRWLLRDEETGAALADHQVDLARGASEVEIARFRDLYQYARLYSAPDRRVADGARIVADAGAWARSVLLGERLTAAIAAAAPVTVRVTIPAPAESVLLWPLELAHDRGRPLAARGDVSFVYDIGGDASRRKHAVGATLRILAVFSQPTRTSVLALRRERYALSRLIRRIAGRARAAVDLRVVQYGVTREKLAAIADSGDGWDVLHLAGHGGGGLFLLEQADGAPDPVPTDDLVALLRPTRHRVKLAVASACESAADTTAETLRLLGLTEQADALEAAEANRHGPGIEQLPGLARALARELDCAVVAMRYPVTDDFAIAFGDVLYDRLLGRAQSADVAVARATAAAAGSAPTASRPATSLGTPGLFGMRARGLKLVAPLGQPRLDPAEQRMAYFPDEPERFVGRTDAMVAASAALASGSARTAVLLHGMAGGGKTACALELAYRHQDGFAAAAFWQAPAKDEEWQRGLADFASELDLQLGDYGFSMAAHITTTAALEAFAPRLRELLRNQGILLVLDNLETQLTQDGSWRDPKWAPLIAALTGHDGESRVILTSRIGPAGLPASRVVTPPVHALSLDESVTLAQELPNLRKLLHAEPTPAPTETEAAIEADRARVNRVLRVVQGHPKLLELADAAAADPDQLDAQLAAAEAAAQGQELDAFFRDGASAMDEGQFLDVLSGWTVMALAALPEPARLMARFLACLEDSDRQSSVIRHSWADLWDRLGRAGGAPAAESLLDTLAAAALTRAETTRATGDAAVTANGPAAAYYRMHPGVAAAIDATVEPDFRAVVDTELWEFWQTVLNLADEQRSGLRTETVVRAGLGAVPYLLRLEEWDAAVGLLEEVLLRDSSPAVVQPVLPWLWRLASATETPRVAALLAMALRSTDHEEAELLLREVMANAAVSGDYRGAAAAASFLVTLLRDGGRLREALTMADRVAEYHQLGEAGPWSRLAAQALRLQILAHLGEHQQVLTESAVLIERMAGLPVERADSEHTHPPIVRELVLNTRHLAAVGVQDWHQALELSAEIQAAQRQREETPYRIAEMRFNDATPLLALGRLAEADRLLAECQQAFEEHSATGRLAALFAMRALLENERGRAQEALKLIRMALRFGYAADNPDPRALGGMHHDLALNLRDVGGAVTQQWAHGLAGALLHQLLGMVDSPVTDLRFLAGGPFVYEVDGLLQRPLSALIEVAERTEGVRLRALLAALQPDPEAVDDAYADVCRAFERAVKDEYLRRRLEPVLAPIASVLQRVRGLRRPPK